MKLHHRVKIFQVYSNIRKGFLLILPLFLSLAITLRESVRSHSEAESLFKTINSVFHVHRLAYGGTVEKTSRRAHMQSLHGQGSQHCLHPLWSPSGVQRVCAFSAQVPHM